MCIRSILLQILLLYLGLNTFTIDAASLRCYEGSFDTFSVFSLNDPTPLLNSSCYDPARRTVFYAFGFYDEASGDTAEALVKAYLTLPVNIVLLNWEEEASGGILGSYIGYLLAVHNAGAVGRQFGQALVQLNKAGMSTNSIELIGFSLGAQLMSSSAREFQRTGQSITRYASRDPEAFYNCLNVFGPSGGDQHCDLYRPLPTMLTKVTGLDPARPLFDGVISFQGLDETSAEFVMVVHTNPGELGSSEDTGTVDIWPNCESSIQPGCINATGDGDGAIFSTENSCSHNLVWKLFAEAIRRPQAFIARSASSCDTWSDQGQTIFFGDQIPLSTRGNFYFSTNPASSVLYGRGEAGSVPDRYSSNLSFTSTS